MYFLSLFLEKIISEIKIIFPPAPRETFFQWSNIWQILLNIIGGIMVVLSVELYRLGKAKYFKRRFKSVFGSDVDREGAYHLVYAQLGLPRLFDQGIEIVRPYIKPENPGTQFSIERPVSFSETRASKYLAESIGKETKRSPALVSDLEVRERLNISFISFGGPLSNFKTRDLNANPNNHLLTFDNKNFTSVETGQTILRPEPGFDYGIILKVHPGQFIERTWIGCEGRGEWGTSGAAWYLANKWQEIFEFAGDDSPFALIIRVVPGQDESAEAIIKVKSQDDIQKILREEQTN